MRPSRRGSPSACLPREETGEERGREDRHFYVCQDFCIGEARRLFGFALPREDFRELDSHGREAHIAAIVGVCDTYGADWTDLCAHVPELAAAVPASKGGLKGKGKGRPTLANPAAKPKAAPIAKGAAEPAAAPKAAEPKAAPKAKGAAVPASVEPASGSRDTRGTPPKAASGTLGGGRVPTSASSSEGTPVAAPWQKGLRHRRSQRKSHPRLWRRSSPPKRRLLPTPSPTAADVLPKEEPQLDDLAVKEEPAEEVQAEAPEEEIAEPIAEEEAVKEEAPDFEGAAEEEQGPTPIDVDEEAAVHSSPVAEVVSVHSPASPDLSERAFGAPRAPRARGAASRET